MNKKTKIYLLASLAFLCIYIPNSVRASEISISPIFIEETLSSREDAKNLVTLKNSYTTRKAVIYATVNEIDVDAGDEIKEFISPIMSDRTNTVTSWIEVTRARIEIPPGESREVPINIRLHPQAKPGVYYVFIGFVEASNKPAAQAIATAGDANGVIIKVTVEDEREDSMKIKSFIINRFVTSDDTKEINVEIENLGDLSSAPSGEIIFYDSRGIEVTSIPVSGDEIKPGEKGILKATVPISDNLGRYKANLSLKYGENQTASLFDTNFFYLIPINTIVILFVIILLLCIVSVLLLRKAFAVDEVDDTFDEVAMYIKQGHEPNPKDHDIHLKNEK